MSDFDSNILKFSFILLALIGEPALNSWRVCPHNMPAAMSSTKVKDNFLNITTTQNLYPTAVFNSMLLP
jgi:hypothetical protein